MEKIRNDLINEIVKNALLNYKYKNKTIMNTYIKNAIIKNKLNPEEIEKTESTIAFYIDTQQKQKEIEYINESQKEIEEMTARIEKEQEEKEKAAEKRHQETENQEKQKTIDTATKKQYNYTMKNKRDIEKEIEKQQKNIEINQNDPGIKKEDLQKHYILSFNQYIFEIIKNDYIKNNYFIENNIYNDYILNKYKYINNFVNEYTKENEIDKKTESKEEIATIIDNIYINTINKTITQIKRITPPPCTDPAAAVADALRQHNENPIVKEIHERSAAKTRKEKAQKRGFIIRQIIIDLLKK